MPRRHRLGDRRPLPLPKNILERKVGPQAGLVEGNYCTIGGKPRDSSRAEDRPTDLEIRRGRTRVGRWADEEGSWGLRILHI